MKKILMVGVLLTTLLFSGCTSNKKTVDENMTSKDLKYSTMDDAATQDKVYKFLSENNIDENDIDMFMKSVKSYYKSVEGVDLLNENERLSKLQVPYNLYDLSDKWLASNPNFTDQNCRLTAFRLFNDFIIDNSKLSYDKIDNTNLELDLSTMEIAETSIAESTAVSDVILNIIPTNPINSLAEGNMLQIIVFALLIGLILAQLKDKAETVGKFFTQFNDIMMKMTTIVMKAAPIGVFCLIATTFSTMGWNAFAPLLKYIFAVFLALAIHCLVTYMLMLKGFTKLSPIKFLSKFAPVMSFAFSTASSNASIPLSIETLDEKLGVSENISSFTVPLGATINMDGTAIMQGVAVVFVAQAFGINLGLNDYLTVILTATLASIGTAGVPGVGMITLSMVFNSIGLPVEGIGLIMGIDRILDMCRTAVNVTGDAVCTTIIAKQYGELDESIFNDDLNTAILND